MHPHTRGERRAIRKDWISRRKYIVTRIWSQGSYYKSEGQRKWIAEMQWSIYAKFNLNCGCTMCHCAKYFKNKRKRRKALQRAESQNDFRRQDKIIKY